MLIQDVVTGQRVVASLDLVGLLALCDGTRDREEIVRLFSQSSRVSPTSRATIAQIFLERFEERGLFADGEAGGRERAGGFAHPSVHRLMLSDRVRTEAYREAIDQVVRPGDCVVDVGTGSGVLALFALRAGAEQVHAVEITDIITLARSVAERNGGSKIVFHRGDASTLELGVDADVIVSESMGAFALYEGMFKHVVAVRDRCLRSGGTMIPSAIELWLAPMDGSAQETPGLGFWLSSPYGIDMSPFLQAETSCLSSRTERVNPASLLAPPARLTSFDCLSAVDSSIDEDLAFVCVRDGVLEGFCGHFDAILSPDVTLTTSPTAAPTHWRQHVFPCQPVALKRGEELEVHFEARTSPSSPHQPLFFISARRRGEELFTHRFNAW